MDISNDVDAINFLDLLDSVGLQQHIKKPTHVHGHTLDLVITRSSAAKRQRRKAERTWDEQNLHLILFNLNQNETMLSF